MRGLEQSSRELGWVCATLATILCACASQGLSQEKDEPAVETVTAAGAEGEVAAPAAAIPATRVVNIQELLAQIEAQRKAEEEARRADPAWKPSHQEVAVIKLADDLPRDSLHNFCLHVDGTILACVGTNRARPSPPSTSDEGVTELVAESGEIQVFSPDGELLATWKLDMKPEAICAGGDGTVFVGGGGRLAKLTRDGKVLAMADSPAVAKQKAEQQQEAQQREADGEDKQEKTDEESESVARGQVSANDEGRAKEARARVEAAQAAAMARRVKNVTGIAVTQRDLFVASPMTKGYGYAVWRMDHDLGNPKQIVEGLRGCCGQMDIQAKDGELWIPENARHRVTRYDRNGNALASFGKRDRKAADGFGGCCEPKNLRFGSGGDVYTAESGPPVAVKRWSPEGELLGVVGLPVFETGCVRVTVEVDQDAGRVFVLNGGGNAIHVLGETLNLPTHEQVATISIPGDTEPVALHTFCLDSDGNLLAAAGGERMSYTTGPNGPQMKIISEPAGIRVLNPEGDLVATWELDLTPQAMNVAEDGTVYVGGQGRLAKLDKDGKVLQTADAPNLAELPPLPPEPEEPVKAEDTEEDRAAEEAQQAKIAELRGKLKEAMKPLQAASQELQASKGDKDAQVAATEKYNKIVTEYLALSRELRDLTTTPQVLAMQQRAAALRKRAVTGIAVTGKDLFVACPAAKGYGYDVWRVDRDLGNPKKIVTGLSGCCGQMDIQAWDGQLYVAENARGRVVRYDRDGNLLSSWGEKDRKSIEGFGSCCNPMNIRFGPGGVVYTSESNLGRIKRFSLEGEFLGVVGTVKIIPGCKHVPIGISGDGSRVYLLDITRSHIVVMASRDDSTVTTAAKPASTGVVQ